LGRVDDLELVAACEHLLNSGVLPQLLHLTAKFRGDRLRDEGMGELALQLLNEEN